MDAPNNNPRETNGNNENDGSNANRLNASQRLEMQKMELITSFFQLIPAKLTTDKVNRVMKDEAYAAEANILRQVNGPGVLWGMAAGISTFAFLRRGPVILIRAINRRNNRNSTGGNTTGNNLNSNKRTTFSSSTTTTTTNSKYQFDNVSTQNNPFNKTGNSSEKMYERSGGIFGFIGFVVDSIASLFVAANVSMVMTDTENIRSLLADIPLVEGRSVVSDELCIDSLLLFNQYPKEFWTKAPDTGILTTEYLKTMNRFVRNCEKRAVYEDKIREQRGLSRTASVAIPSPGVPPEYNVEKVDGENENDFFTGDSHFNAEDEFNVDFEVSSTSESENWNEFDSFDDGSRK